MMNLPNLLTLSRIALIPLVSALMFIAEGWAAWAALGLYSYACITDWFDGYLARKWKQESPVGKFLDPIADKLLVGALLLVMAGTARLTFWALPAAVIILLREILVSGLREFLAGLSQVKIPVSRLAKWKTAIQMIALGFLIIGDWGPQSCFIWFPSWTERACPWLDIGGIGLWIAAIITVITGWDYMVIGWKHMNQPRSNK